MFVESMALMAHGPLPAPWTRRSELVGTLSALIAAWAGPYLKPPDVLGQLVNLTIRCPKMNPSATIFSPVRAEHFSSRIAQVHRSGVHVVNNEPNYGSGGEVAVVRRGGPEHLDNSTFRKPTHPKVLVVLLHLQAEDVVEEVDGLHRCFRARSNPSESSDSHHA